MADYKVLKIAIPLEDFCIQASLTTPGFSVLKSTLWHYLQQVGLALESASLTGIYSEDLNSIAEYIQAYAPDDPIVGMLFRYIYPAIYYAIFGNARTTEYTIDLVNIEHLSQRDVILEVRLLALY